MSLSRDLQQCSTEYVQKRDGGDVAGAIESDFRQIAD